MSMFWTTLKLQEPSAKKLVLGSTWLSSLSNLPTRLESSANTYLFLFHAGLSAWLEAGTRSGSPTRSRDCSGCVGGAWRSGLEKVQISLN